MVRLPIKKLFFCLGLFGLLNQKAWCALLPLPPRNKAFVVRTTPPAVVPPSPAASVKPFTPAAAARATPTQPPSATVSKPVPPPTGTPAAAPVRIGGLQAPSVPAPRAGGPVTKIPVPVSASGPVAPSAAQLPAASGTPVVRGAPGAVPLQAPAEGQPLLSQTQPAQLLRSASAPQATSAVQVVGGMKIPDDFKQAAALISGLPLTSNDEKNRIYLYQQRFSNLGAIDVAAWVNGFLSDVVTVVMVDQDLMLNVLVDVRNILEVLKGKLASLNDILRLQPDAANKRGAISDILATITNKTSLLAEKIHKQQVFLDKLNTVRALDKKEFAKKLDQYTKLVTEIDSDLINTVRSEVISDLANLAEYVQKQKNTAMTVAFKNFIQGVLGSAAFNPVQQAEIISLLHAKATLLGNLSVAAFATGALDLQQLSKPLQEKVNEFLATKALQDKIIKIKEFLELMTKPVPGALEKAVVLTMLADWISNVSALTKSDFLALKDLFLLLLKNQFVLATNQRAAVQEWIETIDQITPLMDAKNSLLNNLKTKLATADSHAILAAFYALMLLPTAGIPSSELDTKNKGSLIGLLRINLPNFYNRRDNQKLEDLVIIQKIFTIAKSLPLVADVVNPAWADSLTILLAINVASQQANMLLRLAEYETLSTYISTATDRYEKGLFIRALTNIFDQRKVRAQTELTRFLELLQWISSDDFRWLRSDDFKRRYGVNAAIKRKEIEIKKKIALAADGSVDAKDVANFSEWQKSSEAAKIVIFPAVDIKMFADWITILQAVLALLNSQYVQLGGKIKLIEPVLPTIALDKATYEKDLLANSLSEIWQNRGDFKQPDIALAQGFFVAIAQANALAANQVPVLMSWTKELNDVGPTITGDLVYLQAMLNRAAQTKDIVLCEKALNLFTPKIPSSDAVRKACVDNLVNVVITLFNNRTVLDNKQLAGCFQQVYNKKINNVPLVSNSRQREVLAQWITILAPSGVGTKTVPATKPAIKAPRVNKSPAARAAAA